MKPRPTRILIAAVFVYISNIFATLIANSQSVQEPPVPVYIYSHVDKTKKACEDSILAQKEIIEKAHKTNDSLRFEINKLHTQYSNCLIWNYIFRIAFLCLIIIFSVIFSRLKKAQRK